jgi:PEGA domain
MSTAQRFLRTLALALSGATLVGMTASAQEAEGVTREAAKHFQRGVGLYGEADYRAALVEFKRAYALVPNAAVLYNVGETEYQLQDYAGALTTFKRYLAEANPTEAHRSEVESNVDVLRSRVGHLTVQTVPLGADIAIDDQPIGKTPLVEPVLVSIGHRKVVATIAGRPTVSRYVDVAAEDNVFLTLTLSPPAETSAAAPARPSQSSSEDLRSLSREGIGPTLRVVGWITAGALVAGSVTFGILANKEASDLKNARSTFPTTAATLSHDANLTTAFSVATDALGAAAIVVGGITLYSTLSSSTATAPKHGGNEFRVTFSPTSARLEATF